MADGIEQRLQVGERVLTRDQIRKLETSIDSGRPPMPSYHIHDKGPGSWLERVLVGDCRYTVCEGPAHAVFEHWRHCHVIGVASSMRGVRRLVSRRERKHREGRGKPFYEYPATRVEP